MRRSVSLVFFGLLLAACMAAHGAWLARLVEDIAPGEDDSLPRELTEMGGVLYFTAIDGVHGRALWRSDGTQEGTNLLKLIIIFADRFTKARIE